MVMEPILLEANTSQQIRDIHTRNNFKTSADRHKLTIHCGIYFYEFLELKIIY